MEIATTVTTPILIAVLSAVVGVIVVGVGGGLIRPMSQRWETYLNKAEEEAPRVKAEAQNSPSPSQQLKGAAQQAKTKAKSDESGAHRV